jgi:hypothetical protein
MLNFLSPLKLPRLRILKLDLASIKDSFYLINFLSKYIINLKIISFQELKFKIGF